MILCDCVGVRMGKVSGFIAKAHLDATKAVPYYGVLKFREQSSCFVAALISGCKTVEQIADDQ